jgi:hypothetical protein
MGLHIQPIVCVMLLIQSTRCLMPTCCRLYDVHVPKITPNLINYVNCIMSMTHHNQQNTFYQLSIQLALRLLWLLPQCSIICDWFDLAYWIYLSAKGQDISITSRQGSIQSFIKRYFTMTHSGWTDSQNNDIWGNSLNNRMIYRTWQQFTGSD